MVTVLNILWVIVSATMTLFAHPVIYSADCYRTPLFDFKTRKKITTYCSKGRLWCTTWAMPGCCGSPSREEGRCSQVVVCWWPDSSVSEPCSPGTGLGAPFFLPHSQDSCCYISPWKWKPAELHPWPMPSHPIHSAEERKENLAKIWAKHGGKGPSSPCQVHHDPHYAGDSSQGSPDA